MNGEIWEDNVYIPQRPRSLRGVREIGTRASQLRMHGGRLGDIYACRWICDMHDDVISRIKGKYIYTMEKLFVQVGGA